MRIVGAMIALISLPCMAADNASLPQPKCFRAGDVAEWGALSRRGLVLRTNDGQMFALDVIGICPDLRYARVVNFKSADVGICGHPGESIRVERQTCYLDHVREASEKEQEQLRVRRP
jgi:hypothetical protein